MIIQQSLAVIVTSTNAKSKKHKIDKYEYKI